MEALIKKLHREWDVGRRLSIEDYIKLVKDTYITLQEEAKAGKLIFYGKLEAFKILRYRSVRGRELPSLIGAIVGACSEYEAENGRPLISSIVISKIKGEPGLGFYYLSKVPPSLSKRNWEDKKIRPPEAVIRRREEFWLSEVQRVHDYWQSKAGGENADSDDCR